MQQTIILIIFPMVGAMVFSATLAMSWRSVLLVEENGVPRENHQHVASHWQTLHRVHLAMNSQL